MQYVWEMISSQQIVILFPLMVVEIPPNTYTFFQKLMTIAAVELIPTDLFYRYLNNVKPQPISKSFEEVGFEHHLIMDNFGTLGFIFAFLPLAYALYFLIGWCSKFKRCRRLRKKLR